MSRSVNISKSQLRIRERIWIRSARSPGESRTDFNNLLAGSVGNLDILRLQSVKTAAGYS